jgi:hypothetical protein
MDRMHTCVIDTSAAPHIIDFPPSLDPIPAKPVLFDLAFDYITFPDLSARKPEKKKGLFGLF